MINKNIKGNVTLEDIKKSDDKWKQEIEKSDKKFEEEFIKK